MVALPDVPFLLSRPSLVDSVSVSRVASRVISFVETADPVWQIPMRTGGLDAYQVSLVEAFRETVRTGRVTVLYTPRHVCLPQAYWGDPGHAHLSNNGNLVSVTGGFVVALNSVENGLDLRPGDLFSLEKDGYRSLHRVVVGAVASGNAISVTVEPAVPPYITSGAVARFKDPELNCRVLPGSFSVPDDFNPVASFLLVEVPK